LTDACALITCQGLACLQVSSHGIALGSEAFDGSGALGRNRFKSCPGSGFGLCLRKLTADDRKGLHGFPIALFEQSFFGSGCVRANPIAKSDAHNDSESRDQTLHHFDEPSSPNVRLSDVQFGVETRAALATVEASPRSPTSEVSIRRSALRLFKDKRCFG
jgi:hypothetical protein